jgi:hypothetical protein
MSNAQTRISIATALSAVPGVKGYPRRPKAPRAGDAWPVWRGSERDNGTAFVETFAVVVALAGDEVTADTFADTHGEDLEEALRPWLYIESLAPAVVAVEGGDMNALMLTGRTE